MPRIWLEDIGSRALLRIATRDCVYVSSAYTGTNRAYA